MSLKRRRRRTRIAFVALLVLLLGFSALATKALMPLRRGYGCMWRSYGAEPENTLDVLYLGTSIAYADMIPAVVYRESGLTSFSLAGPVQTMTESYYYLRQALRTQHPSLILLEVSGLLLDNIPSYDLTNINYMPLGLNRLRCALETAELKDLYQYLFPLSVYHDRWKSVTWEQIKKNLGPAEQDLKAGWTLLTETTPFDAYEPRLETWTDESFQRGAEALRRIVALCQAENIQLVMCLSPRCGTLSAAAEARLEALWASLDAPFVDFDTLREDIGIDDKRDFFDLTHLNVRGAEKYSRWLAAYFTENCGIQPAGRADAAYWNYRITTYDRLDKGGPREAEP